MKKITIAIIGMMMITLVIAAGVSLRPNVMFSKEDKQTLTNAGIGTIKKSQTDCNWNEITFEEECITTNWTERLEVKEEGCDENNCRFSLIQGKRTLRDFNINSSLTNEQIEKEIDLKVEEILKKIIEVEKRPEREKRFDDGDVVIHERK